MTFRSVFSAVKRAVSRTRYTQEEIIAAMDPWTLACATAATNKTDNMWYGLDLWLELSEGNWIPEVMERIPGATRNHIVSALRKFVAARPLTNLNAVLREVESSRGMAPSLTLGPGESVRIPISVNIG